MIVFNSIDVNFVSNGTLLAYNVLYSGIIRYLRKLYCFLSVRINFCARKNLGVGGWGPGNPYAVRIVKIVRFIGRSLIIPFGILIFQL